MAREQPPEGVDEGIRAVGRAVEALRSAAPLEDRLAVAAAALVPALAERAEVKILPDPAGPAVRDARDGWTEIPLIAAGGQAVGLLRVGGRAGDPPAVLLQLAELAAAHMASAVELASLRAGAEDGARAHDEFLATLSHELRTPLNVVVGWVDLLRRGKLPPEKHDRALELIDRNARVQTRLMDDLLDVSRMMAGRLRLEARALPGGELVRGAVEALRPQAEEVGLTIDLRIEAEPELRADPERVSQILHNLLGNAVKFTPAGGRIEVALAVAGADAVITVTDTGPGIAPELLPHLFDRFVQGERKRLGRTRGLGLGLFIARHLARMHGGDVTAESEGPGKGARFTVRLPLAGPA